MMDRSTTFWDEYCPTDVDIALYAGLPVNEVVFWHGEGILELPAWKLKAESVKRSE